MNWDDVKILLAIARAGGLSRAAKTLGVSVSTVHRRANELERSLKATLFSRGADGYTLTDAGHTYFTIAEQAEEHLTAMERGRIPSHESVVRIALPELLGQQIVLPELGRLQSKRPELRLEISTSVVPVEFSRREADVSVRLVRPKSGRYSVRRIGRICFGLFCSREYLRDAQPLNAARDISSHKLIGWDRDLKFVFLAQWLDDVSAGGVPAMSFDTLNAQLLAAVAGYGIALLPTYSAVQAELIQVLPNVATFDQGIWMLRHRDTGKSRYADEVCTAIEEAIRQHRSQLLNLTPP